MRQAHFAFRRDGTAWSGRHSTYASRFDGALSVAPVIAEKKTRPNAITLRTTSIARGGREFLARRTAEPRSEATGSLAVGYDSFSEHIENRDDGVEQSWRFSTAPAGAGDLVVRIAVTGQTFRARTEHGLHFWDAKSGVGVRYGLPTWIDARGVESPAALSYENGEIRLTVPEAVLRRSDFPAVLDPTVSPEIDLNNPLVVPAYDEQSRPRVRFGGGNYLVVWKDARANGQPNGTDVYGTRVTPAGVVLDPSGIPISTGLGNEYDPDAAFDGTNWLVVWTDERTGTPQIRGARLSTGGTMLDPTGFTIVSTASGPAAVAFGTTEYLVTYVGSFNVAAHRVSTSGTVTSSSPISIAASGNAPVVAFNGTNFLVAWKSSSDGRARRVAPDGTLLDASDISITAASVTDLASDGTDWLAALGEGGGVRVRRVFAGGALGSPVSIEGGSGPSIAFIGGTYYVGFTSTEGIKVAPVDASGAQTVPSSTVVLSNPGVIGLGAVSLADDGTNVLVVHEESEGSNKANLYATRVSPALQPLDRILVSGQASSQGAVGTAFNGTNYLVVWEDFRPALSLPGGAGALYATRVSPTGTVLDPAGLSLAQGATARAPSVASNGTDWLVAWQDIRVSSNYDDVYAGRVLADGTLPDGTGIPIYTGAGIQTYPTVASDGSGYLVAFGGTVGRATRVSGAGAVLDNPTFALTNDGSYAEQLSSAFNGTDYLVTWLSTSSNFTLLTVKGTRVTMGGSVVTTNGFQISSPPNSMQDHPSVASNGSGFYVAWGQYDVIRGTRVSGTDTVSTNVTLATGANTRSKPVVGWDGSQFWAAWQDKRKGAGDWDIYATRIDSSGNAKDPSGIAVATAAEHELVPAIAGDGAGSALVAYSVYDPDPPFGAMRARARLLADLLPPGTACTLGNQCASGNCVQNVCCDDACSGACKSCLGAHTGGTDGTCGNVTVGSDPKNLCSDQGASSCGTTGVCGASGACALYPANTACGSPVCDGTELKDQFCDGSGGCVPESGGDDCAPFTCSGGACDDPCGGDAECVSGHFCSSGSCVPKGGVGAPCAANSECADGHCVDDVCCDDACDGACEACSTLAKGAGDDGACEPVAAGGDPDDECSSEAPSTCGRTGDCDGSGACQLHAAGVSCGMSTCDMSTATGLLCDGGGACVMTTTGVDCAPYACDSGACQNPCEEPSDCLMGTVCVSGTCRDPGSVGTPCSSGTECTSGHCVDDLCCDTACSGTCVACSVAKKGQGADGECGPIRATEDPDRECAAEDESTCGQNGQCNGSGACARWAEGTECAAASCTGTTQNAPSTCDADGACASGERTLCVPGYRCDGSRCATGCSDDSACAAGYVCDVARDACVAEPEGSAGAGAGGESGAPATGGESGAPATGGGSGTGGSATGGSAGTPPAAGEGGEAPTPKPGPTPPNDDGGCSCRVAGENKSSEASLFGIATLLVLCVQRRRRRCGTKEVRDLVA